MAQIVKDIVTWLQQWFYTESEVDTITGGLQTQINNKADTTTVSSLSTTVGNKADKTGGVAQITDANAHSNIGTSANATQSAINTAIDTALSRMNAINVVSTLPTASSSTMGGLYIISENNKVNVYYTEQSGSSYSWHKMDADILDELTVSWSDVQDKPSSFTPSSHASSATTYGVGTTSNYGHNKTINNLTQSSHSNGTSLSAYQGYVLKGLIDDLESDKAEASDLANKSDKTATVGTTITLVDAGETNEGCIIFNTIS